MIELLNLHNNNSLKILIWNAHSINNKLDETFIYLVNHNIDIALITESWLKSDKSLFHQNYKAYNLNRQTNSKGGVIILVKRNIKHSLLPSFNLQIIEALGIDITTYQGNFRVIVAYFNGGTTNTVLNKFKSDIQILTAFRTKYIIGGDLNAKHPHWNNFKNNRAGTVLYNEMLSNNFTVQFPNSPTHYNPNSKYGSTLDIALTNCPQLIQNMKSVQDLSSDHLPVHFDLNSPSQFYGNKLEQLNYAAANWAYYKTFINGKINLCSDSPVRNIATTMDIDQRVQDLNNIILLAKEKAIPYFKSRTNNKNELLQLPTATKMLISLRNTRRRQWQRTRDPCMKEIVNELNQRIKAEIQILRNNRWHKMLLDISKDKNTNKFWKISKNLRQRSKTVPPISDEENNQILITNSAKCDAFAKRFARIHNNDIDDNSDFSQHITSKVDSFLSLHSREMNHRSFNYTKPQELMQIIKSIKTSKCPGEDIINGILIKNLPKKGVVFLTYLFNACLKLSYFSKHWKTAKVIPIPKPGKSKTDISSYRPISLLNIIGKLFEIVLKSRIDQFVGLNNILPNEQFGFRREYSTQHQALRIFQHVKSALKEKQSTGLVLFDIEKAFDRVWHNALIFKLIKYKFPIYLIKIIHNYLNNRNLFVYIAGDKSPIHPIFSGVPQGAVLSPILYNIYTADLSTIFSTETQFAQYADDTAIYVSGVDPVIITSNLQICIKALIDYCNKWNIKLNPNKTQAIFFTRRRAIRYLPTNSFLQVNNTQITWSSKVKYLGIWFDQKIRFHHHIEYIVEKTQKQIKILYPLLCRSSKLSIKNKILIYKMIIRAAIVYGCQLWKHAAQTNRKRLQILQNRSLKIICNLPRRYPTHLLHKKCELETISELLSRFNNKFTMSCLQSSNELLRNLLL